MESQIKILNDLSGQLSLSAQSETRIRMDGGTYEIRKGNTWEIYTHHCWHCYGCGQNYPTDAKGNTTHRFGPVDDSCSCGDKLTWMTNERALEERINLHAKGTCCGLCDVII